MSYVTSKLTSLGEKLTEFNYSRYQSVYAQRMSGDIERIIENNSVNMNEAAKLCRMSRNTFKAKYEEAVANGIVPEALLKHNKYLFTLKHMHVLMDYFEIPKWSDKGLKTQVINLQNQKGGTGKSTTATTLAASLAIGLHERMRVLLIDLDPQGSLRNYLLPQENYSTDILTAVDMMLGDEEEEGLYRQYLSQGFTHEEILANSIHETHIPSLHVLPSFSEDERFSQSAWLHYAKTGNLNHVERLKETVIDKVKNDYDVILIDTGPHINPLVWSAQYACDGIVVPFTPRELDWHSTCSFLSNLPINLEMLPNKGENVKWFKCLATNYNIEFGRDKHMMDEARRVLGDNIFSSQLVSSYAFEAAARNQCTIFDIRKVENLCSDKQLDKALTYTETLKDEFLRFLESVSGGEF
ncbi:ParA family protein [Catenovulum agarivorans]|uniref:ParA family protein n=1 Tax=Catenovulum agarivorans TaxID=1172192 RepID=UPI000302ED7D|nr:ParA family protein [Catenovulum agarivorans]